MISKKNKSLNCQVVTKNGNDKIVSVKNKLPIIFGNVH